MYIDLLPTFCRQWEEQYQELARQRQLLDDTMNTLKDLITSYGGSMPEPVKEVAVAVPAVPPPPHTPVIMVSNTGYDSSGSWAYKIEFVLEAGSSATAPLPVAGIAAAINSLEPMLDGNKIIKAVTMEASKMGLNGRIGIKKKGNKNFYFMQKQAAGEQSTLVLDLM